MGSGLRLTYLGHATVMIELDGVRLLTDPVLGRRLGPLRRLGPTPDPAAIGPVDGVLISHGHPDHFNGASLRAIAGGPPWWSCPEAWGRMRRATARADVREVRVNERVDFGPVRVTAVPARHGRWLRHRDARPIGYLIEGSMRVYFAGDTALYPGMAGLAGRVDVALLPVGRWGAPRGPDRLGPSTAVEAATLVGARVAIPIHWGTLYIPGFAAGRWGWGSLDAGDAFATEAARRTPDLDVRVLRPGESTGSRYPGTPRHRAEASPGRARDGFDAQAYSGRPGGTRQEIPPSPPSTTLPQSRMSARSTVDARIGPRPTHGTSRSACWRPVRRSSAASSHRCRRRSSGEPFRPRSPSTR